MEAVADVVGEQPICPKVAAVRPENGLPDPVGPDAVRPKVVATNAAVTKAGTDALVAKSVRSDNDAAVTKVGIDALVSKSVRSDNDAAVTKVGTDALVSKSARTDNDNAITKAGSDALFSKSARTDNDDAITKAGTDALVTQARSDNDAAVTKVGTDALVSKSSRTDFLSKGKGTILSMGGDQAVIGDAVLVNVLADTKSAKASRFTLLNSDLKGKNLSPILKRSDRSEDSDEEKSLSPPLKRCTLPTLSDDLNAKVLYSEEDDDDEEEEVIVDVKVEPLHRPPLPPREVIGPDENGYKKYIDYRWVGSNKVRTVTTTKVHKIATVFLTPRAAERQRTWTKFGDAVDDQMILRTSTSGIVKLERAPHFSERATTPSAPAMSPTKAATAAREEVLARGGSVKAAGVAAAAAEAQARGQKIYPEEADNERSCFVIKLDQLPLDCKEGNVRELAEQFGRVIHVALARNPRTGASLRYALVYFFNKHDGEAALHALADGLEATEVGMLRY